MRETLNNGAVMLWNDQSDSETVAVRGFLPAGAARESAEQTGLAVLTARLLRRGTERKDAQQIAAAVEDLGASFGIWGSTEEAGFSAKCLRRDLETVLDLLGEVLQFPTFAEAEIQKTRDEVLTQLREQEDSTRSQADLRMHALLYPADHPYSRGTLGNAESVAAITRADLQRFHACYYGSAGMKVSVAGLADPDVVRDRVGAWFSDKPATAPSVPLPVTPSGVPQRARVPLPHKSQVDLVIAGPGIPRLHPDFYAFSMVNLILGSLGLMGRLGERIREQQGMAYYVYSQVVSRSWAGEWAAHAGVAPENVERTIEAVLEEVSRIRAELVSETEFADACDYLIGSLPLRLETNDGVASAALNGEYFGLGLDYLERYPGYIRAETRESLRQAAYDYLDPSRFSIAMAGPV